MSKEMVAMSDDIPIPTKPLKRQVSIMNLILATVSVGVAAILLTAVVMSPSLSPLASVHDSDGDGHADSTDDFPDDPSEWSDSDGDGVGDFSDYFPNDVSEWNDADDDGYGDNSDEFPEDENEWADSDGDGVGDNSDDFPDDPDESIDSDGDGVGDGEDEFPEDSSETSDSDGDGVGDNGDLFPDDPYQSAPTGEFEGYNSVYYFNEIYLWVINMSIDASWNDITISISDGYHDCAWGPSSDDLSHEPNDVWNYGSTTLGDLVIDLAIMDYTADGNMSQGDALWFTAYNVAFRYGTDYVVSAIYEPAGVTIADYTCREDLLYCPYLSVDGEMLADGVMFTVLGISTEIIWSDLEVALSDEEDTVTWNMLSEDDLNDEPEDSQDYGPRVLGDIVVRLTVVDVDGNGYASVSDHFILNTDSFEDDTLYTIAFIYEPLDEIMSEDLFTTGGTTVTPTTQLTKSTITNGIKLTFAAISETTQWTDVTILISDGSNTAAWINITSEDLTGGAGTRHNYASVTLGSLIVWLNITDLSGNGYLNQGDYMSLTANSFASTTTYTVTVIFEPTACEMTHINFNG
ncbi:MAG: hypothetical protein E4H25_04215 [Methanomassiliicoccus sp.]|nr:MAG: hypothetical protein E4H25_04215 [Methanomassiliicoccus sp.]